MPYLARIPSYLESLNQSRVGKEARKSSKHLVGSFFCLLGNKGESSGKEAETALKRTQKL
jgi:hypothetical protein